MSHLNALRTFLAAYFHQDWMEDHATSADVVDSFRRASSMTERRRVRRDVKTLLARNLDDDELRRVLLDELHCYLRPPDDAAGWLRSLADALY